MAKMHTAN